MHGESQVKSYSSLESGWIATCRQSLKKFFAVALIATLAAPTIDTRAQAPPSPPSQPAPVVQPATQQDQQRTAAVILVKNAILAVNHGNLTGNYTVLRDLASSGFRERNSAADLAGIFQNIRQQKIDLSPIVVLEPALTPPRISQNGELILEGHFASQPLRINFQLAFLKSNTSGWMIHAVSLNAAPEPAQANEAAAQTSALFR